MDIIAERDRIKYIGYQGENRRQRILFDLSPTIEEYPNGTAILTVQRPGESMGRIPTETELDGSTLIWTVGSYYLRNAGILRAQVVYSVNNVVVRKDVYRFMNEVSVISATDEDATGIIHIYINDDGNLIFGRAGDVDIDFELNDDGDLLIIAESAYLPDGFTRVL